MMNKQMVCRKEHNNDIYYLLLDHLSHCSWDSSRRMAASKSTLADTSKTQMGDRRVGMKFKEMTKERIKKLIWRRQNIRILGIAKKEPHKSTREILGANDGIKTLSVLRGESNFRNETV